MDVNEGNSKIATLGRDCDAEDQGAFRAVADCSGPDSAATDVFSLAHLAFGSTTGKLDSSFGSVAEGDERQNVRRSRERREHRDGRSHRHSDEREAVRGTPDNVHRHRRISNAHGRVPFGRRGDRGFEYLYERYGYVNSMLVK